MKDKKFKSGKTVYSNLKGQRVIKISKLMDCSDPILLLEFENGYILELAGVSYYPYFNLYKNKKDKEENNRLDSDLDSTYDFVEELKE